MARNVRPLTAGETALFERYFPGHGLRLPKVRFCNGHGGHPAAMAAFRNGNTAITLLGTIYYGPGKYCGDFSAEAARETKAEREAVAKRQALFMHEMTHVWQWRRLGAVRFLARYARDFIKCRGNARAMYRYEKGVDPFAGATLEAQAQMVGDYAGALVARDETERALIAKNLAGSGFYGL